MKRSFSFLMLSVIGLCAALSLAPVASGWAETHHATKAHSAKPAAKASAKKVAHAAAKKAPQKPVAKAETAPAAGEEDAASPTALHNYTRAVFVYHPATGTVLYSENPDVKMGPASLTKMMTLYLTFDALKHGKISMETPVPVSEKAWRTGGSKMFIEVGKQVRVEDLIRGIAIVSGNDACVAMAEYLGGTEPGFVQLMNAKAKELGMASTVFVDSNGLPDPAQVTTSHDMAMLITAIFRDFPEYKKYMAEEEFTFNGIHQGNRNGLLHAGIGIDAGKTGHTEDTGYHLASTAVQNGERLVVVVMGTNGFNEREGESLRQYRTFFATYATRTLIKPGDVVAANVPVWQGTQGKVDLTVAEPVAVFTSPAEASKIKAEVAYNQPLTAPLSVEKPVGELTLTLANGQTQVLPLVPRMAVPRAGFAGRFGQTLLSKFGM